MLRFLKRHRETLLVTLLGLVIFGALNWMMVGVDPERFTNAHLGPYSAFKKLVVSGFDFYTYSVVSMWQPRYELYRHPLLYFFMWPLAELNKGLKDFFGINCAIYIIGIVWTILSTMSWLFLYKIIRKVIELPWLPSLIYTLLFFSFSHVMLVTFLPDHMLLSMTLLLGTVYIISTAKGNVPIWKIQLLYLFGTGITTTNCVKIWIMDMCKKFSLQLSSKENFMRLFKRSLFFFLTTTFVAICCYWQETHSMAEYREGQDRMINIKLKTDSVFAKQHAQSLKHSAAINKERASKQLSNSKFLAWTDNSVDRLPLIYENIFGEGLLLHTTHLLEDANNPVHPRPVIVRYSNCGYYVINGIIVLLSLCGIWLGRRKVLVWMVLLPFLFDMLLHIGLRFASADVYIMTAHWAFILPIGIAYMDNYLKNTHKILVRIMRCVISLVVIFLWYHNLGLTSNFLSLY